MIKATARRAVWHLFGQLPRNATQREREARERLIETFAIIRQDQNGKALSKRDVELAYRRFNAALARRHPDVDINAIKWRRHTEP
jgi:thioredoxin-like negative regulator of GroEL